MNFARKTLTALSAVALVIAALPAEAQGRHGGWGGGHGGYYRGGGAPGWVWGGLGVGLGIGLGSSLYYGGPWNPGYVVVERPVYYNDVPAPQPAPAPSRTAPLLPDPVIYPRNGQSPAQTEADRQECNRWATTQESAMRDASVFQRATLACLEGRGYTVK